MGEIKYKELIKGMTWSYSRIDSYSSCPYKWYLHYILGKSEVDMFYSSYGSFLHELIASHYLNSVSKEEMKKRFILEFADKVKGERPSAKIVENYIQSGIEYFENFEPFPFNMVEVETKHEFNFHNRKYVGIIDFLGEKDGEYYIVDNKSRNLKPRSKRKEPTQKDKELDEMLKQLYLYAGYVKEQYGKFPKALCFNCFRNRQFIIEEFKEEKYNEVMSELENAIEDIIEDEDFLPDQEYFKCFNLCGFKDICVHK